MPLSAWMPWRGALRYLSTVVAAIAPSFRGVSRMADGPASQQSHAARRPSLIRSGDDPVALQPFPGTVASPGRLPITSPDYARDRRCHRCDLVVSDAGRQL